MMAKSCPSIDLLEPDRFDLEQFLDFADWLDRCAPSFSWLACGDAPVRHRLSQAFPRCWMCEIYYSTT
ncbi:hypothetical protein ACLMAJ_12855 [Nocardia sp. KC 131]|uniref:hypothetical protein n=1 Tax=Nocardia arseniciresistens TaxID=3392119 RepID=UPI00398F75B2